MILFFGYWLCDLFNSLQITCNKVRAGNWNSPVNSVHQVFVIERAAVDSADRNGQASL
jgi:hypothetical protein